MTMLGNRLREARLARQLSLNEVASKAKISVATLSRIERDKQGLDLSMFITLSKILKSAPKDLLGPENGSESADPLASQIARLDTSERTQLWKELSSAIRTNRNGRTRMRQIGLEVEELLAQIDFLRDEIRSVQKRLEQR
jgi:transcriptional regulator with XRE-family HTH domain